MGNAGGMNANGGHLVQVLLDTGSLGLNGNYISETVASTIDKDSSFISTSNHRVCSGLTGLCSDDIPYLILLVSINHYLNIELKFYIIKSLPFQGIIGIKAIRQHYLVKHFPTFFGLSKADIAHEAREGYAFNGIKELPPSKVEALTYGE